MMFKSLLFFALVSFQCLAFTLRGTHTRREALALPALYCIPEKEACEADDQCMQCLTVVTMLDNPNLQENSTCDDLLVWWDAIGFNNDENCYFEFGFPVLAGYLYCLFDTYKYYAEIDVCETGPTMAPTMAPTTAPIMMETA